MTLEHSPYRRLQDLLVSDGWTKLLPSHPDAYVREQRYMTWVNGPVIMATSGTSKYWVEKNDTVEYADGCGYEVTLEAIKVDPHARQQGLAQSSLETLVSLSARAGVSLYLEPVPLEPGINKERLMALYLGKGFRALDAKSRVLGIELD